MTNDLIEFLRARLDEDETQAHAAFSADSQSFWTSAARTVIDGEGDVVVPSTVLLDQAVHIARHDPARVLREVKAKRLLLNEHWRRENYGCGTCTDRDYPDDWPCPTAKLLALPYSDHPDYDEAWQTGLDSIRPSDTDYARLNQKLAAAGLPPATRPTW